MPGLPESCDILIAGGGMAGASLGAEMARDHDVLVLEMEAQPGYHATGRSVAFWMETYGGPDVQPLTRASGPLLARPDPDFSENSFLAARGGLHVGTARDEGRRREMVDRFSHAGVDFAPLDRAELHQAVAGLRDDYVIGLAEPSTRDIDVAALHGAYLAQLRRRGGQVTTSAELVSASPSPGGGWLVNTTLGQVRCRILVNAAGAWADEVAGRCGVRPLGIEPLRRTVVQLRTEPGASVDMPVIMDLDQKFYFKPVGQGRIWLSPHDEIPDTPHDVAPEELDVAIAIDRFEHVVDWKVEAVERRWAGLRSFAPDRLPVYGFDPRAPGFFWFAGQGGFGIQTAPAAALVGGALLRGDALPAPVRDVQPGKYSPNRFGRAG